MFDYNLNQKWLWRYLHHRLMHDERKLDEILPLRIRVFDDWIMKLRDQKIEGGRIWRGDDCGTPNFTVQSKPDTVFLEKNILNF